MLLKSHYHYYYHFHSQISVKRIQVELYCEKDMVKAMGSEWEPNVFIPAGKMIRTLDSPNMQPFIKEFNITAYGVKVKNLITENLHKTFTVSNTTGMC